VIWTYVVSCVGMIWIGCYVMGDSGVLRDMIWISRVSTHSTRSEGGSHEGARPSSAQSVRLKPLGPDPREKSTAKEWNVD
jgi:hypothetical protein